MNKKSLTKNYIYNLMYQVLVLILPLITAPYISRVLGAEKIGIYSYTIAITTYFITFGSLGVALYGQRETAYVQHDRDKYSKIFWEIVLLRLITLSISMIIFYYIFVCGNNLYQIYYKVLLLEIVGNILDISWFFRGLEEFKKTVIRNMIIKIISVISIFLFVKSKNDLIIYFFIYVLSILIGNLSLWLYLPKFLTKVKFKELNLFMHLKPTIALFIPQIAIQVYTLLDKTMIGSIIVDKHEVGYYDQGQKIIKMLLTIITSLGVVMMPRIANNFALGNKERIKKYMSKSFNMVFLIGFPMIFGILSVSKAFVPVFFGKGYDRVILLMNVISPIILFIGLSNVTGTQYLLPTKRQKEYTISVICGALINFIMNMSLIPRYGALGASIGTVIAEFTVTSVQMYYVRKDFNFVSIIKSSFNYIIASIVMFITCMILRNFINSNFPSIMVQVVAGSIVYVCMLLILNDKFTKELLNKIFGKFKKRSIK